MHVRRLRILSLVAGAVAFCVAGLWPAPVDAQGTPFVPYFGKNRVRYVNFDWYNYRTDHFDIYYYPELEEHLERVASYAESAYQRISTDLKHDLAGRVPLILFKTQSEFQLQNISGGELPEGVLAFAEPFQNRMVLPIDEPPDQLYRLITHELTHVFEFDIIPRGLVGADIPLWMDEGLANYMAGYWNILDLMQVRDAAISDSIPPMSDFRALALSGRLPYSLGHAAFEFIEERWGLEGLRQFLFSLRKSVVGSNESAYMEALKLSPEEFDEEFDRYLKDRFRAFRDKELPSDYGRNLAPSPEETEYVSVLSLAPSPEGDMIAAAVGNVRDFEIDIVLISASDGQFIRNLTKGFDQDRGFEYIAVPGGLRGNLVPWFTWSPVGDQLAFFARTAKSKTLVVQNVVTGKTEQRVQLDTIDAPESPAFGPNGRRVVFSGLRGAVTDIFLLDLDTETVTNLTNDATADYAPAFSPDGGSVVYAKRVGGNDKLFLLDLATGEKRQLTFGSHDDTAPRFYNDNTVLFTSTAMDPNEPVLPEVARNGNIPNVWTLDLDTGELRQWTDTATGNVSPVVLRTEGELRVAFISHYKGDNGIHVVSSDQPIAVVASDDFGLPGPIIPFQAPLTHTLVPDNVAKKGAWERMSLAGRPPVSLGVTSGGDIYGNTALTFTDLLGDKEITFFAQSIAQYRTTALTYVNMGNRLQYAISAFSSDRFFYGSNAGVLYDPSLSPFIDRDLAQAVQTVRGATGFGIYPFSRYSRVELSGGYLYINEEYLDGSLQLLASSFQQQNSASGQTLFNTGHIMPLGVAFVRETSVFRDFGPIAGDALRLSFEASPSLGDNWLQRQTVDLDARHYTRLGANGVFAVRLKAFKSWGRNPAFMYYGGNSEMRGYEYLEFLGNKAFFANAELRFPLVTAMLTPIGVLGGLRGVFFFNVGASGFEGFPFRFSRSDAEIFTPQIGFDIDDSGNIIPVTGPPIVVDGFRLIDGRASYGFGLQSFALGFPMHFDWSWRTLFNKGWEDVLFARTGGSTDFRRARFDFWIGYDF